MGSLSAEEGRADKIFGWTDGVIFHFSLVVLVEVAEGFCSEQCSSLLWHLPNRGLQEGGTTVTRTP